MPKRRRIDVDETSSRRIDVNTTSFLRHVPAWKSCLRKIAADDTFIFVLFFLCSQ